MGLRVKPRHRPRGVLATAFTLCISAIVPAADAGSINANTATYAGDVGALVFPVGTVAVTNYTGYRKGGTFFDSDGAADRTGNIDTITNATRMDWIAAKIYDMPLVLSASLPYGYIESAELGGQDLSTQSGFFAPNIFVTLGIIVDPKNGRTLALSTYVFFPVGDYDSAKAVNVATPNQTVTVPQFAYEEGLGKFIPALQNFWIDIFGGAAFHSEGDNPVTLGGIGYDHTEQGNSYDINAYLRYNWSPLTFVAIGIEKSWGGEQIARGGALGGLGGDLSLGKDEYVKGHLQFGIPLSPTVQVAADITHDFHREGGFREDFTAEIRLSTFIMPAGVPME
jgi:hypothetical protein